MLGNTIHLDTHTGMCVGACTHTHPEILLYQPLVLPARIWEGQTKHVHPHLHFLYSEQPVRNTVSLFVLFFEPSSKEKIHLYRESVEQCLEIDTGAKLTFCL